MLGFPCFCEPGYPICIKPGTQFSRSVGHCRNSKQLAYTVKQNNTVFWETVVQKHVLQNISSRFSHIFSSSSAFAVPDYLFWIKEVAPKNVDLIVMVLPVHINNDWPVPSLYQGCVFHVELPGVVSLVTEAYVVIKILSIKTIVILTLPLFRETVNYMSWYWHIVVWWIESLNAGV